VKYCCHQVPTQLRLNIYIYIISYHIIYHIISHHIIKDTASNLRRLESSLTQTLKYNVQYFTHTDFRKDPTFHPKGYRKTTCMSCGTQRSKSSLTSNLHPMPSLTINEALPSLATRFDAVVLHQAPTQLCQCREHVPFLRVT
jgi:hypothetical protein